MSVHELQQQLEAVKASSFAATAARAADRPLTHATCAPTTTRPTKPTLVFRTRGDGAAPSPTTVGKGKGKATALPTLPTQTALPSTTVGSSLGDPYAEAALYDDKDSPWSDDDDNDDAADAQATNSLVARQVHAILSGTPLVLPGGSTSGGSLAAGRVTEIHPRTIAEFRLTRNALEPAYNEGNPNTNELLAVVRKYISNCHRAVAKSALQKAAIESWRVPDWAETVRYDPVSQAIVNTGLSKSEVRNQKVNRSAHGPVLHAKLQRELALTLGLVQNGQVDTKMGSLSSPRHEDHPELWRLWSRSVATTRPKGFIIGPDGAACQRSVRGFRRIAPLFKDKKGVVKSDNYKNRQKNGQATLMSVIARPGCYAHTLQAGGIEIHPNPSWEPIEFSANANDVECARHLAMRGVTVDEVNDYHLYAYAWLDDLQAHETVTARRVAINGVLLVSKQDPHGWPEHLDHYYDMAHARWLPTTFTAGTTTVIPVPACGQTEVESAPSLTSTGTSGQKPHSLVAVPLATKVTDNISPPVLDENVEMKEMPRIDDPEHSMDHESDVGSKEPA